MEKPHLSRGITRTEKLMLLTLVELPIAQLEQLILICKRYMENQTLESIAEEFALSHQRVHEIIHRWCD